MKRLLPARLVACITFVSLSLAPLAGYGIAEEATASTSSGLGRVVAEADSATSVLPLTSVVLYSSGMGHFLHDGIVEGNSDVAIDVPVEEVNDFLKSLVVQDFDGGTIGVVRYGSREPADRALRSYAIDLSGNPDIASILTQARGEAVHVTAERTVSGTIISVTTRTEVVDGVRRTFTSVALNTAEGIEAMDLNEVRRFQFANEALQSELEQAIATLARDRTTDTREIVLSFRGTGSRRVRIGYVRQTPVWKTSYRLVLGDEAQIQAWAIVENTTGEDWDGVQLSLVTGAPISFRMNLYDPVYIERPSVDPPVRQAVGPQVYESNQYAQSAPRVARAMAETESFDDMASGRDMELQSMNLSSGVREQSTARDLGAAFAYDITEPVSIGRYSSALVPIVNRTIIVHELSIYDQTALSGNPFLGAEVENSTGVHLMPGPITVFDDAGYAGDAQIGDIAPGAEAYMSFAIDLDVSVSTASSSQPEEIRRVQIINGVMQTQVVTRRTTVYTLTNRGRSSRTVMVQHPKQTGWNLLDPRQPDGESGRNYRFRVAVPSGATTELPVEIERVQSQSFSLSSMSRDRMIYYIESREIDEDVRSALERIVELQAAVDAAVRARRGIETDIQDIYRDQERIRANLSSLESGSRLYDRYVTTLSEQEDVLEQLDVTLTAAREAEEAARDALEAYLSSLTV